MEPKQAIHDNYFVFSLLRSCYVTDMIKKLKLYLLVTTVLFKTEFGHLLFTKSCIIVLFLVLNGYFIYQDNSSISSLMAKNIAVYKNLCGSTLQKQKTENCRASQHWHIVILFFHLQLFRHLNSRYLNKSILITLLFSSINNSKPTKIPISG